jgi:aldose 1-epimerase
MNAFEKKAWGDLPSGEQIFLYTLRNAKGIEAQITNFGGRVVTLRTPDRRGKLDDIVLGFDDLQSYVNKNPFFGALVGRYANRIANGEFSIDGKPFHLAKNNGTNALHGGLKGFDKVAWQASGTHNEQGPALKLTYVSKEGEEGYPGTLTVHATYTLADDNELQLEFEATTDRVTVLNLTNHSYFDLTGTFSGNILDHEVTINADRFTPVNANLIPTGELRSVYGTPFDFTQATRIGARIDEGDQQLKYGKGYDHNFVIDRTGSSSGLVIAARVTEPKSGRVLEVLTTQPGMQFYTGNHLEGDTVGKGSVAYGFRHGFCLETQHFPDSPNQPNFPSTRLNPGQEYRETTVFRFSTE